MEIVGLWLPIVVWWWGNIVALIIQFSVCGGERLYLLPESLAAVWTEFIVSYIFFFKFF